MIGSTTRALDQAFLEAVLADEDFLNAEFLAIISAEWPIAKPPRSRARHRPGFVRSKRRRPRRSHRPTLGTAPTVGC